MMATVALAMMLLMAGRAWADGTCDSGTGYHVCPGEGGGSAVGSAVVNPDDDLPVTGSSPVRGIVVGSAFVVVGAAAVAGSVQARRRSRVH